MCVHASIFVEVIGMLKYYRHCESHVKYHQNFVYVVTVEWVGKARIFFKKTKLGTGELLLIKVAPMVSFTIVYEGI